MEIKNEALDHLIQQGMVESKPAWQFFQEIASQLEGNAKEIMKRATENPLARLTDDEKQIWQDFERCKTAAAGRNEEPRYRLASESLHSYIAKTQEE